MPEKEPKIFRITTRVTQTMQHNWKEEIFVKAFSEEQAQSFIGKHGRPEHWSDWTVVKGSEREEEHYKYPGPEYDYMEGGIQSLRVEPVAGAENVVDAADFKVVEAEHEL